MGDRPGGGQGGWTKYPKWVGRGQRGEAWTCRPGTEGSKLCLVAQLTAAGGWGMGCSQHQLRPQTDLWAWLQRGRGLGGLGGWSLTSPPQLLSPANGTLVKNGSCVAPGECRRDVYSLTCGPHLSLWISTACCENSCSGFTPQGWSAGPGGHTPGWGGMGTWLWFPALPGTGRKNLSFLIWKMGVK